MNMMIHTTYINEIEREEIVVKVESDLAKLA